MPSPTERSLKYLRDAGYHVEIVEKYNSFTRQRKDLFGFADLLAIRENEILLVQVTSRSNVSARVAKITASDLLGCVRKAGFRIEVHGWGKLKSRWTNRVIDLS